MQVEVEYKPISKKDYQLFIKILARMLAEYIRKNKEKKAADGQERLLKIHR